MHLLTHCIASVSDENDYLNNNMSCEYPLVASVFYRDIPQYSVDIVKVTYPWYECDFAPKLTGIPPCVVILADTEDPK